MATSGRALAGRTVLVTGAARGIGAETARQMAGLGARVALVGLEPELLDALARELGDAAAAFPADVRDADQLEAAVAAAVTRFGGIDVVIANAGVATGGSVDAVTDEDFERTVDVNLLGVWRTVRVTLPHLVERRGYLLLVASFAAVFPPPQLTAYSASKAGVEALGDSLRVELRRVGVDVGVAYFGFIDTDMVRSAYVEQPGFERLVRSTGFSPLPVQAAAAALVRGVDRRARRVVLPRLAYPAIMVARLARPLLDRRFARVLAELLAAQPRIPPAGLTAGPSPGASPLAGIQPPTAETSPPVRGAGGDGAGTTRAADPSSPG